MKRDNYGIIVQENGYQDKVTGEIFDDGGDSAFSTGLMAFAGSYRDYCLMPEFITYDLQLVRHPYQSFDTGTAPHDDPKATSADQVLAFFSGIYFIGAWVHPKLRAACLKYAQSWRVNRDILTPAHKLYLYRCANERPPLWLIILGYPNQLLTLLWDSIMPRFVKDMEMTRAVTGNVAFGRRWITFLFKAHPDLLKALDDYFGGWRGRIEIADALENKIIPIIIARKTPIQGG